MIDVLYVSETSNQHDQRFENRWKELGKSVVRLDSSKLGGGQLPYELSRSIDLYSPRLVQVGPLPSLSNFVLDAWSGPTLAVSWGFDLLGSRLNGDYQFKNSMIRTLKESSAILVDSRASERVAQNLGANPDSLYYLPWGVEDIFLRRDKNSSSMTANSSDGVTFISTRNHEPVYNLGTVVRGFCEAGVSGSKLLIAGTGSETENLKAIATSNTNPSISLEFLGGLGPQEMMEVLSRSNFYISAASVDGSSVSLLEAMAMGVVPVVPNLPGNREWVDASVGHLFDPEIDSLHELIKDLAAKAHTHAHKTMSLRASEIINEGADWTKNSALLGTIFETLVNGHSP